jgi:hypothetical protein
MIKLKSSVFSIQTIAWLIADTTYNLGFSPLAPYPGPKLLSISKIPYQWSIIRGRSHHKMLELHNRYGPVGRVGLSELSYNSPQAFQDIYKARPGRPQYAKDPNFYGSMLNPVSKSIAGSIDDKHHGRLRRLWAGAFSERALRENEAVVVQYADLLIQRLREDVQGIKNRQVRVDIKEWFNYAAFDVTGDLLYAESFDCLEKRILHPWNALIFALVKGITIVGVINQFRILRILQKAVLPTALRKQMLKHVSYSIEKTERRLKKGTNRPDFLSAVLRQGLVDSHDNYIENQAIMTREEVDLDSAL